MNQIKETTKLLIFEEVKGKKTTIYRQHKEDESKTLTKIYHTDGQNIYYSFDGSSINEIIFKGFTELPSFISEYGYGFSENSINNFFKYKFENDKISAIVISENLLKKSNHQLFFKLDELEELLTTINQEQRACNDTKNILINNYISSKYPELNFEYKETNNNKKLILRNLNNKLIEQLTAEDVEKIGEFYVNAAQKYKRADVVKRMISGIQKNSQLLTLQEIINKFEKLLKDNPAESEWQKFFNEYITLFDNRYVRKLDNKNIATAITKFPDLILVDIYGYIDFYELKKYNMPLIKYDDSHKTFYWSKEVSMVIAQVSDYLQKAKENGVSFAQTIKKETATEETDGLDVNIINPRAIIVAGSKKELNTPKKRDHFKNLRESLKDIEFVLYDELLDRLKNLFDSVKVG